MELKVKDLKNARTWLEVQVADSEDCDCSGCEEARKIIRTLKSLVDNILSCKPHARSIRAIK